MWQLYLIQVQEASISRIHKGNRISHFFTFENEHGYMIRVGAGDHVTMFIFKRPSKIMIYEIKLHLRNYRNVKNNRRVKKQREAEKHCRLKLFSSAASVPDLICELTSVNIKPIPTCQSANDIVLPTVKWF